MSPRTVSVFHGLFPRRYQGRLELLFVRNRRWRDERTGAPLLALPAKKLGAQRARPVARVLMVDELGLSPAASDDARWAEPRRAVTRLSSPALRRDTVYDIHPLFIPVSAHRHAAMARRGGEWLSPEAALASGDLSPTARLLVRQAGMLPESWSRPGLGLDGLSEQAALTARLAAAKRGDYPACDPLFEQLRARFLPRLARYYRDFNDAEDAVQAAFMGALERLDAFHPERGEAVGWLWTVLIHLVISDLRGRKRRRHLFVSSGSLPEGMADGRASGPSPLEGLTEAEGLRLVEQALADVLGRSSEEAREAFRLISEEGMKYQEVALATGAPLGTVISRVDRTREKIADALGRSHRRSR